MTITSQIYIGIDVSKDRLDGAVLGKKQPWQVDNAPEGIQELVEQMTDLQPELADCGGSHGWLPAGCGGGTVSCRALCGSGEPRPSKTIR